MRSGASPFWRLPPPLLLLLWRGSKLRGSPFGRSWRLLSRPFWRSRSPFVRL
ncbi:MAG: hypothetical protein WDN06_14790 [Asticcacaulis sp.]